MKLIFDHGTLVIEGNPEDAGNLPGVLWDPQIRAWRAPACFCSLRKCAGDIAASGMKRVLSSLPRRLLCARTLCLVPTRALMDQWIKNLGETLVFPDFAVIHRRDPSKTFLLEIVGFWTPEYLREKLDRMRLILHNTPLILCIDRGLNCGKREMPAHARIVWFQKRIDPQSVLAAIEKTRV
jgi:hypothetical protein